MALADSRPSPVRAGLIPGTLGSRLGKATGRGRAPGCSCSGGQGEQPLGPGYRVRRGVARVLLATGIWGFRGRAVRWGPRLTHRA